MHLELVRDGHKVFPSVEHPEALRTLRVWHCKFATLQPISAFRNLVGLEIATFPDNSFQLLANLAELRYLHVLHAPHLSNLEPLSELQTLTTLRLATLPSWDSSRRRTTVDSLDPIAALPEVEHIELVGVVPIDGSLRALERCPKLSSARLMGYSENEVERFRTASSAGDAFAPEPWF
jgi:hypothetical protein